MPEIEYIRPELRALLPAITLIEDVVAGSTRVKEAGTTYLPQPDPTNKSKENQERYKQYLERAILLGATPQTLEALVGQVFAREPVAILPSELENLLEDVDSRKTSLNDFAKTILRKTLKQSRCGILVDYPKAPEGVIVSKADQARLGLRPIFTAYDSSDIINWRCGPTGVTMVVLREDYIKEDDQFKPDFETQYRVLRLVEGTAVCELWRENEGETGWNIFETSTITGSSEAFSQLPFVFVGWRDNKAVPDSPPMEALARLEIGHYRNSADFEEASYISGQPTPVLAGLTEDWVSEVLKGEVRIGSRGAIPLPAGGSATLLQAVPNILPKSAMEMKELQMSKVGAKLIEPTSGERTATEAILDASAETSVLGSTAKNTSKALEDAIVFAAQFTGTQIPDGKDREKTLSYELNTDFSLARMSPQERASLLAEWQGGAIPFEEMRWNLKRAGLAYLDDKAAQAMIDAGETGFGEGLELGE